MSVSPNNSFMTSIGVGASILSIRIGVLHLLTARERIMTGNMAQEQDKYHWLGGLLKIVLGCVEGTNLGGPAFIERCERTAKGAAENEPFFLILALAGASMGSVPTELGTTLVQTFVAARCGHTIAYLLGEKLNTTFRTISF
eukprot:CAMPEP_0176013386 /NCGR_PEP_ID=MMETSP0120_2-20121206/6281_1 /TAXON_ID=160619 /ORGANISM="Kryptoperidinium foliaceum, Strain CCMP 1326" /LENGTH=141 /DNA_ID=CAMNT_0017346295 /DNA_START=23 /DNA_END=445 /DNA_ORIENTATION=-